MTRRTFFRIGVLAVLGAVASGGALAWLARNYRLPMMLEKVQAEIEGYRYSYLPLGEAIRRHFHYLDLDPGGVETFAQRFESAFGQPTWRTNLKDVYLRYLMSTDFFQNGGDQSRTLHFVVFYNPIESPCYNPLVRLS